MLFRSTTTSNKGGSLLSSIARIKKSKNTASAASDGVQKQEVQRTEAKNFVVKKQKTIQNEKSAGENLNINSKNSASEAEVDIKDIIAKCKERAKTPQNQAMTAYKTFREGTRVFHQQFGVGHILKSENTVSVTQYTVEFTKAGIKTLDASLGALKTF